MRWLFQSMVFLRKTAVSYQLSALSLIRAQPKGVNSSVAR
jgi:hypothetical protein